MQPEPEDSEKPEMVWYNKAFSSLNPLLHTDYLCVLPKETTFPLNNSVTMSLDVCLHLSKYRGCWTVTAIRRQDSHPLCIIV